MQCLNCGTMNRAGASFCRACGTRLATPEEKRKAEDAIVKEMPDEPKPPSVVQEPQPPDLPSELHQATDAFDTEQHPQQAKPMPSGSTEIPEPTSTQDTAATPEPVEAIPTIEDPEAAPPSPIGPGALIAGRFKILEILEAGADVTLYSAYDLGICPQCGGERDLSDDEFCSECGAALDNAGPPVKCKLQAALSPDVLKADPGAGVFYGDRFYLRLSGEETTVIPDVEPTAQETEGTVFPHGITLTVGYASHTGMVRDLDEDSLCVLTLAGVYKSVTEPSLGLFIVADGMGGHEGGEVASKLTVQTIVRDLVRDVLVRRFSTEEQMPAETIHTCLTEAINNANEQVYHLAQKRANDMGCTLTMALVMDGRAYIANVGDSRTYIRAQEGLKQITTDHSVVASLIAAGMAEPEEIYTHPDRSLVYRAIGTKPTVEVDIYEEKLAPGDTLLLCCDGLWEAIHDEGIDEVLLSQPDPQAACNEMIRRANQAGGEDNISVIVVKVNSPELAQHQGEGLS